MRLFLKRAILFILLSSSLFAIIFIAKTHRVNEKSNFKLNSNKKILILGHSHTANAFIDTLIPFTKNFSLPAESYLFTLSKARKVIEQNQQIKYVFLECSNNQFSELMDFWTWGNAIISQRLPQYLPFLNNCEKMLILKKNPKLFIESTSILFRDIFTNTLSYDNNYIDKFSGRFLAKNQKKPAKINKTQLQFEVSETNIQYLIKLISYIKLKKIKVFLIRTPTLMSYFNNYSEDQYQKILKLKFKNTVFLDFSKFDMEYTKYIDKQHMNYDGAREFSIWFSALLNKGLLEQKDKQLFINNELKKRINYNGYLKQTK